MTKYTIHYAEDVPCFGIVEIEAKHDGDAIVRAIAHDWDSVKTDPQYELAADRRIVHIMRGEHTVFDDAIPVPDTPDKKTDPCLIDALKKARHELAFQQKHFPRADDTELRETLHRIDQAIATAEGGAP